jgi:hypothetical protein
LSTTDWSKWEIVTAEDGTALRDNLGRVQLRQTDHPFTGLPEKRYDPTQEDLREDPEGNRARRAHLG